MPKLEAFLTILAWIGLVVSLVHLPLKAWAYLSLDVFDRIELLQRGRVPVFRWKASSLVILLSSAWLIAVYWS